MNSTAHPTETIASDDREKLRLEQMVKSLHALLENDAEEQKETFVYLQQVIDEARPSYRKRFNP